MIVSTLTGLLANLFVVYSGNSHQDNPISYYDYCTEFGIVDTYREYDFTDIYSSNNNNLTLYLPINWEEPQTSQKYFIFYWRFNNGSNSQFPYYMIGGFGYNYSWGNDSFRWYVPIFNSNDLNKQSIDNLSISLTAFSNTGTPYYDDGNSPMFNTSIDYATFDRGTTYGAFTINNSQNLNLVDDPSTSFGALVSFNVSSNSVDSDYYYNQGYNQGYSNGYDTGYNNGTLDGDNTGFDRGYKSGYTVGFEDGSRSTNVSLFSIMGAIIDTPIYLLRSLFDYELFGISIYTALLSLATFVLVIWIVRKII